jgi:hypothetical protein
LGIAEDIDDWLRSEMDKVAKSLFSLGAGRRDADVFRRDFQLSPSMRTATMYLLARAGLTRPAMSAYRLTRGAGRMRRRLST